MPVMGAPELTIEDGEWIKFYGPAGEAPPLPDEAYLREAAAVDLDDPEALMQFVADYGMPGHLDWSDLGASNDGSWWRTTYGVGDLIDKVSNRLRSEDPNGNPIGLTTRNWIHADEVAVRLAVLRNCVSIWNAYDLPSETVDVDRIEPFLGGYTGRWRHVPTPRDAHEAAAYLGTTVTYALIPYSPTLTFQGVPFERGGDERVSSYAELMRQFYGHLVERARYSICANETCQRMFVRKRTGTVVAEQGRTTGRAYCSASCQAAQKQREYRRRKSAEQTTTTRKAQS